MEDKFCNYILALILIFLQQKIFQTMLTFQELMLVSHLILPWRQAFQPHFSNLDYTIQLRLDYTIQLRLDYTIQILPPVSLILAIYAHILGTLLTMLLTFQEHMLVSHLILPPVSLILAIYAHFSPFPSHFSWISFLHFFLPNWSCFPLNVFTST